jgi:hypothetical protein
MTTNAHHGTRPRRDRHERRADFVAAKEASDSQLLAELSAGCSRRMFIRFDVTARREEQPRVHVVDEQDIEVVAIEKDGIGDEMPIRGGRLGSSKHVICCFEPPQCVGDVLGLQGIEWSDVGYEVVHCPYGFTHEVESASSTSDRVREPASHTGPVALTLAVNRWRPGSAGPILESR